jgi:hypothetical protein
VVELNSTIFPLWGPIGTFVNAVKVLVGGVFGIYLIILYFRWREYTVMRKMLTAIRRDIRFLAEKQGVHMEPFKTPRIIAIGEHIREKMHHKPKDPNIKSAYKRKKK